jgi:hypothetical protein
MMGYSLCACKSVVEMRKGEIHTRSLASPRRGDGHEHMTCVNDFPSQIISYILNMLICVDMILLDKLIECLLFIVMIDISKTYDISAILI